MADESNKHGTKNKQNKRRLFEDISVVQVTATALAAVTSMLLSSYIGIAGSVIGVAVASIVSTTAASLYKHFLRESTEKIKEIPVIDKTHDLIEHMTSAIGMDKHDERDDNHNALADDGEFANKQPSDNTTTASNADSSVELAEHQSESPDSIPLDELSIQANAVTLPISELEGDTDLLNSLSTEDTLSVDADRTDDATESAEDIRAKIKEDDPRIKAALIAKRRMKIGLIVVCVVSALIAVALSAVVVYVSSQGQGIGAKPQSIFVPLTTSESSKGSTSDPLDLFEGDHSSSSSSSASSSDSSSSTNSASSSSNSSAESSSSSAENSSSTNASTGTSTTTPDSSSSDASSSSSSEDNAQDPTTT
ncbi:MAG: hypothetical protein HFJ64_07190 [Eggerthellaceae bacterium]|nr:hypothetical protein [Eggerthellaceae bacterium]